MKISVITVCFQSAKTIQSCLDSVRSQIHPDVEHWIIDGDSKDGTVDLIKSNEREGLRWISEPDEGLYFAMNKGFERATGDVIGILNADDFFPHDEVLSRVAREFDEHPGTQACYGDLEYVQEEDISKVVRFWKSEEFRPGMFRKAWMPPHPTFYARREVYEEHGGFDTQFRIGADWDILLRMMEAKRIPTRYIPEVLVQMRMGGVSNRNLKNIWRNNRECWRAFRKYGMRPSVLYPVAKLAHRLPQFFGRRHSTDDNG